MFLESNSKSQKSIATTLTPIQNHGTTTESKTLTSTSITASTKTLGDSTQKKCWLERLYPLNSFKDKTCKTTKETLTSVMLNSTLFYHTNLEALLTQINQGLILYKYQKIAKLNSSQVAVQLTLLILKRVSKQALLSKWRSKFLPVST